MKTLKNIGLFGVLLLLMACSNEPTLQKYFVAHTNDEEFISLDMPTSMLFSSLDDLDQEEKKKLENIRKINLLAFELKDDNGSQNRYQDEVAVLNQILTNEKYQPLFNYSNGNSALNTYFTGDKNEIKEIIVFGNDNKKGLMLLRLTGKNVHPNQLYELMKMGHKMDLENIDEFDSLLKEFKS
ncbi:MAG: DUF4252 domain-containing protein [Bacteroidota bacterium]